MLEKIKEINGGFESSVGKNRFNTKVKNTKSLIPKLNFMLEKKFKRIRKQVWEHTKIFESKVMAVDKYGCEKWALQKAEEDLLNVFRGTEVCRWS